MDQLIELLGLSFMQHAILAAVLVGTSCALLGSYVVLRRMAFVGDAMAHTALPGLVIAHLQGWNLFVGALVADLLTALGIGLVSHRRAIREDTAIGILFTGMFALGVLIISRSRSFRDLTHMLFGNILGVTSTDLKLIAGVTGAVIVTLWLLHKELEFTSFDPAYARVIGLSAVGLRFVLLVLLALTVVSGIQAVGVILTSAMLVTPAATASLVTHRLKTMMVLAAIIAVTASLLGLYASYVFDVASGASIVVVTTAVFIVVYVARVLFSRESPA